MRPHGAAKRLAQRQQAVTLLRHSTSSAVARQVGVSQRTVLRWSRAYRERGSQGLAPKPISGRPRKLSLAQEQQIVRKLQAWLDEGKPDAQFLAELQDIKARKARQPYLLDRKMDDPRFAQAYERYQNYLSRPYRIQEAAITLLRRAGITYHKGHLWRVLKRWRLTAPKEGPIV